MARTIRGTAAILAFCVAALWSGAALAQTSATRTSSFAYDPNSGLLTQEVVEPDTPALRLQTDYTLNAFGHKVTVTVSGADIATRTASTTYDTKGQFNVSASNALSHTETFKYDERFGAPTEHTGPNGLTTKWEYDGFGRKTKELRADGTSTTWNYQYCLGTAGGTWEGCPAGATHVVQVEVLAPDAVTQIAPTGTNYHDQLNRVIAADTEGFDGKLIRVETKYDALGRVEKKSRPYFLVGGTPKWTTYSYDALGRVVTETGPDSATSTRTYNGLTTSATNALSQTSTTVKNSQGQTVQVKDTQNNTTSYEYDPFGNLTKVTDAAGNVTTSAYDTRGRKVTVNDPDMGTLTYTYDVLDKVKTQTNAASEVTSLSYDLLGRVTQRVEPGMTSTWTWDTATKGIGKPATAATSGGYLRTHTYDGLGRPDQVQLTISGNTYAITTEYDASSRIAKVTYPSGFAVAYGYNATGYQHQLTNAVTAEPYWTADVRDAELHLTKQTAGNGVVTYQTFDANTGQLTGITAGDAGKVQSHAYTYDLLGKLLTRSDGNTGLSESFEYDTLNRLTKSTVSLTPTPWVQTVTYSAIGNILSKSDVGTYSYPATGQPRPHGVTSISGGTINTTFAYDAKGNMTSGNGLTIAYTPFNKPASITRGTTTIAFDHDPEHQRFSQLSPSGLTLYIGGAGVLAERFAGIGGGVQWNNYLIVGGKLLVGVHIQKADETTATRYFHTDHLGSISVVTKEAGIGEIVVERLSYDAWGKRRYEDGRPDPAGAITSESNRGFTGHEQLDSVGLIHMNGRVYDPLLGRFGTPDPMTESPYSTQGWNRYSYVGNSPVNFTDPSGYCFLGCFWKPIFKAIGNFFKQSWRAILQIAVTAICTLATGPNPGCAALGSFVSGITSGNLGQALRGAAIAFFTAAAFDFVGTATLGVGHPMPDFLSPKHLANIAGHALVGCVSAVAQGGKCGPGALSAAVGSFAGPLLKGLDFTQNLVAHAVVGGLASVAAGGNFASGAVTAAFGYLFNNYPGKYHDQIRDDAARALAQDGWVVGTEVPLHYYHDGVWYETRADILAWRADRGYAIIEFKTGIDPRLTHHQEYIFPAIANGEAVRVFAGHQGNNVLSAMGLFSGQILPQGQVGLSIVYQYGPNSQPHVTWFGGSTLPIPYTKWRAPGGLPK